MKIAIEAQLEAKGVKLSEVRKDPIRQEKLASKVIEWSELPNILKAAKKNVADRNKAASEAADDLDI